MELITADSTEEKPAINMRKTYDIHYEFSNGSIYVDITLERAKHIFYKLLETCRKEDIPYFKLFQIKESTSTDYVVFYPQSGQCFHLENIKNKRSRNAIETMFRKGAMQLESIKRQEDSFYHAPTD